jgi:hypothetical protein
VSFAPFVVSFLRPAPRTPHPAPSTKNEEPSTKNPNTSLILIPITVNVLAFHIVIAKDANSQPKVLRITVLAAHQVWSGRAAIGTQLIT